MIQRIQTVHLMCAILIGIASIIATIISPFSSECNSSLPYLNYISIVLIFISIAISTWSIFLFKNRLFQMKMVSVSIVVLLLYYIVAIISAFCSIMTQPWTELAFYLPLLSIVFNFLAKKRIKYDENLVRSADRLR